MSIDSGHQLPGGSAGPFERAGRIRLLALCCVYLVASVAADIATLAWSVRERLLLALVVSLVMVAGLLLRRHRLTDQRTGGGAAPALHCREQYPARARSL